MARSRPHPHKYVLRLARRKPCVHGEPGVELRPHQVLLRPLVTEKGTHQSSRYNAYAFLVSPLADKIQIADAVKELFNVRVEKVRTMTRKGKNVRTRTGMGKTADWKKALVTIHEEDKIDFY